MIYHVTNRSETPRRLGGKWIQPGETEVVTFDRTPTSIVLRRWRAAGVVIREAEVIGGTVAPMPSADEIETEVIGACPCPYTISHRGGGRWAAMKGDDMAFGLASREEVEAWVDGQHQG